MTDVPYCPFCNDNAHVNYEERTDAYKVRGKSIEVCLPVPICTKCQKTFSTTAVDQQAFEMVNAKYREQEKLLSPQQIIDIRKMYSLSQRSLAMLIGMGEISIHRYENGHLQDASNDALLRACKNPLFIKERVKTHGHLLSKRQKKKTEDAITEFVRGG